MCVWPECNLLLVGTRYPRHNALFHFQMALGSSQMQCRCCQGQAISYEWSPLLSSIIYGMFYITVRSKIAVWVWGGSFGEKNLLCYWKLFKLLSNCDFPLIIINDVSQVFTATAQCDTDECPNGETLFDFRPIHGSTKHKLKKIINRTCMHYFQILLLRLLGNFRARVGAEMKQKRHYANIIMIGCQFITHRDNSSRQETIQLI